MKKFKKLSLIIVSFLLLATCAGAGEVILEWDASVSEGITGYKIHIGQSSRSYTEVRDAGNVLTFKVDKLEMGKIYYFAASAYDAEGNESGYSNEVSGLPRKTERILAAPANLKIP